MDKNEYQPIEKTVTIVNRLGLHARAAAKLVTLAAKHQSDVVVRKDGREVSGKSIMGVMMEQGRLSIDVVARETGFADRDRMRRAFLRAYGQPPQVIRRNARVAAVA